MPIPSTTQHDHESIIDLRLVLRVHADLSIGGDVGWHKRWRDEGSDPLACCHVVRRGDVTASILCATDRADVHAGKGRVDPARRSPVHSTTSGKHLPAWRACLLVQRQQPVTRSNSRVLRGARVVCSASVWQAIHGSLPP